MWKYNQAVVFGKRYRQTWMKIHTDQKAMQMLGFVEHSRNETTHSSQ